MDITPYVERLRRDLLAAAEGAGAEVGEAARRLGFALDPATRLALMEAMSQAAAEITSEMPSGGVDVRLDGRDLAFVVDAGSTATVPTAPTPPAPPTPPSGGAEPDDDTSVSRVSLRLPESVKTRAEDAAAAAGQSLNTWLVNLVRQATRDGDGAGGVRVDVDLSGIPFFGSGRSSPRRMSGWM